MVGISQDGRDMRRIKFRMRLAHIRRSCGFFKRLWCKIRQHPYEVIFDRDQGLAPELFCSNCGREV